MKVLLHSKRDNQQNGKETYSTVGNIFKSYFWLEANTQTTEGTNSYNSTSKNNPNKKWAEEQNRYFFQWKQTDGRQTHEKMFSVANHQFSSVIQLCLTLCDPMNRSMPGLPVHHQFPEFTQTYVHWVRDAIQPSHPLSSPFPPAPNPSQHQSLFQWVNSSYEVAKVMEFQL